MKPFQVTILGNNSAIPAHGRHPSGQFLEVNHQSILIDCGEGTQLRLRELENTNLYHLSHIFISHIHGDHCLGLMGLLNTLSLMNRTKTLHICAHQSVIEIILYQSKKMAAKMSFPIHWHVVPEIGHGRLCENEHFSVSFFQLDHRVPCTGFCFTERFGKKKIKIEQLKKHRIPKEKWNAIQYGADYELPSGEVISHEELTIPHPAPKSYAYCSDTRFNQSVIEQLNGVHTAYIESTYTQSEENLASERFHCTAKDAAEMAKLAGVEQLLLGHFSSRYKHLDRFLQEARPIFKNTLIAEEGKTFQINNTVI